MKKELDKSFYNWDLILHIFWGIVFILCIIFAVLYRYRNIDINYSLISSIALLWISFIELSLDIIKYERIIKNYEQKNKK